MLTRRWEGVSVAGGGRASMRLCSGGWLNAPGFRIFDGSFQLPWFASRSTEFVLRNMLCTYVNASLLTTSTPSCQASTSLIPQRRPLMLVRDVDAYGMPSCCESTCRIAPASRSLARKCQLCYRKPTASECAPQVDLPRRLPIFIPPLSMTPSDLLDTPQLTHRPMTAPMSTALV